MRWELIAGVSREKTFDLFKLALRDHAASFNVLLVDSEIAVRHSPWKHLLECDDWTKPAAAEDRHCHLMAQAMEAWFLADPQTLIGFYGQGFNLNALPRQQDVEQIPKSQLVACLKKAARGTKKGDYHKIDHGCRILERLKIEVVAAKARHGRRFVDEIKTAIAAS